MRYLTPTLHDVNLFLLGAIVLAAATIGVYFLRFWRRTGDGLFLMFAIAFWLMSATFVAHAFIPSERDRTILYALRLASYGAIVAGILLKNRRRTGHGDAGLNPDRP